MTIFSSAISAMKSDEVKINMQILLPHPVYNNDDYFASKSTAAEAAETYI